MYTAYSWALWYLMPASFATRSLCFWDGSREDNIKEAREKEWCVHCTIQFKCCTKYTALCIPFFGLSRFFGRLLLHKKHTESITRQGGRLMWRATHSGCCICSSFCFWRFVSFHFKILGSTTHSSQLDKKKRGGQWKAGERGQWDTYDVRNSTGRERERMESKQGNWVVRKTRW